MHEFVNYTSLIVQGDVGGPAVYTRPSDGKRIIIAVNSDNFGCSKGQPNVGTKIADAHLTWIRGIIAA
jgi:hypothetical protein